jgi:hypothetical protein
MIEDRLTDEFRSAVIDEPPLGFDPDDVVDRAVRRRRHRSAITFTVTAVAVLAVGAVAALQLVRPGNEPTNNVASVPTTKTSAGAPPCDPLTGMCEVPRCDPATGICEPCYDRLTNMMCGQRGFPGSEEITKKLDLVVPQVLTERGVGTMSRHPDGWSPTETKRCLSTSYAADNNPQLLAIAICHDPNTRLDDPDPQFPTRDTTLPDGSTVKVYTSQNSEFFSVTHVRTDGVVVKVHTPRSPDRGPVPWRTEQVVTAVATDGRLTF